MTLDAAEVLQVTQLASAVTSEMIRNLARGTGGATLPMSVTRLGTVGGAGDAGTEVQVRPDGDPVAIPAVNAVGMALNAGDRVLVEWVPPGGVYVTNLLSRSSNGTWVPQWTGPSAVAGNYAAAGSYYRIGDLVIVRALSFHGTTSSAGSGLQVGGLPFPIRTAGSQIGVQGVGYAFNGTAFPLTLIGRDGGNYIELWSSQVFGGANVFMVPVNTTTPFTWANSHQIDITFVYDTDAA